MELKEYWPRYLQDLIEFDQIAGAEQPEFTKAVQDVQARQTTSSWSACPNMAVDTGKRFWGLWRPLGTPWKRAAKGS